MYLNLIQDKLLNLNMLKLKGDDLHDKIYKRDFFIAVI